MNLVESEVRLSKIEITDLFGVFTHNVELKNSAGITIIIGENGLGKTVLLELIESFFKGRFNYVYSIVFKELIFEFTDEVKWIITKNDDENDNYLEIIQKHGNITENCKLKLYDYDASEERELAISIARRYPYLRRLAPRIWEDQRTGKIYRPNDIISNFGNDSVVSLVSKDNECPSWFKERYEKIDVTLIKTQRLLSINDHEDRPINTVEKYSNELKILINNKLTESTELSSKLDRTYPNRLIDELKKKAKFSITDEALNSNLDKLEQKRALLDKVGLLEIGKDLGLLKVNNPDDVLKSVLMLYIQDSYQKLAAFDSISNKIELLLQIINTRFKHKNLFINKDNGFNFRSTVIKTADGKYQSIPVSKLSSGEQNELVLFYELIFKTNYNTLILIDEPEISLHISWQNNFISDLREINKLNKLNIVIATHSPDIISNNWDLKVDLKGVE